MTRARRRLVLCWAERRGGAERRPSRFAKATDDVVTELADETSRGCLTVSADARLTATGKTSGTSRQLWPAA